MELLGERSAALMDGSEALSSIDAIYAEIARLGTALLPYVARVDEIGYAEELGARNTAELLTFRHRLDSYQAHGLVRFVRALPKYAAVLDALPDTGAAVPIPDGTDDTLPPEVLLTPERAGVIVSMLEKVPATVPVETLHIAEEQLVGLARDRSPAELRKVARQVRDRLDEDGPEPAEQKAAARERLTLIPDEYGVRISGYLANENAELVCSTIHTGARPHRTIDGERDPRSAEKRRADAMSGTFRIAAAVTDAGAADARNAHPDAEAVAGSSAAAGALPDIEAELVDLEADLTGGPADDLEDDPATDREADLETDGEADLEAGWESDRESGGSAAARAERCATDAATATLGPVVAKNWVPGFGAKATLVVTIDWHDLKEATAGCIADTVFGAGLSAATARMLACDAKIIPVVLGSKSEPLDVGRAERLVTKGMRYALNNRDRGCVVCNAPPVQCDAHHLISWIDGGITAVSNLVLLCRIHHVDLHHGKWVVTLVDGKVDVALPSWADPPSRRHQPPPRPSIDRSLAAARTAAAACSSATKDPALNGLPGGDLGQDGGGWHRERSVLTATDAREATMRAIWGEDPRPEPPRHLARPGHSPDFDPWGEAQSEARPTMRQPVAARDSHH
ncbi:HNH endonuclease [Kribbella sp. NBC_01505]|uniref:HNH endonuclease signature motif containing protein n=1 Tax=Kribbella sp. NBC_01505 TaxID=2903580 RepID=UPI00386E8CDF